MGLQCIRFAHGFIFNLFTNVFQVSGKHFVFSKKIGSILGLSICQSFSILQLSCNRDLPLVHAGNCSFQLINLSVQVLILNLSTFFRGLSLIQTTGHFVKPSVGINNGSLKKLSCFVKFSFPLDSIFQISFGIAKIKLHASLIFLSLDFVVINIVNLLAKITRGVVVLHTESSKSPLLGNEEFLQFSFESCKFSLSLFIEFYLSGSVRASFIKTGSNILNIFLQHCATFLSLGSISSFHSKFFIKFFNSGLKFLNLFGIFRPKCGFIINFSRRGTSFLLFSGNSSTKIRFNSFQIRKCFLGQFEVSFYLLFDLSTSPFTFFSRSRPSSASSKACSSFPFTFDKCWHLSSAAWISSSVFCLPSPVDLFSFPSLEIMSPWWTISSFRVRI